MLSCLTTCQPRDLVAKSTSVISMSHSSVATKQDCLFIIGCLPRYIARCAAVAAVPEKRTETTASGIPYWVSWALTFYAVCPGWIFFRANDLPQAVYDVGPPLSRRPHTGVWLITTFLSVGCCIAALLRLVGQPSSQGLTTKFSWIPLSLRFTCYAAMFYLWCSVLPTQGHLLSVLISRNS